MHPPPLANRVQGTLDWYLTWCTLFSLTQCTLLPEGEGWGAPDEDNSTMDYYSLEYINYQSMLPKLQFIWKCNISELLLVNNGYYNLSHSLKLSKNSIPAIVGLTQWYVRPRKRNYYILVPASLNFSWNRKKNPFLLNYAAKKN